MLTLLKIEEKESSKWNNQAIIWLCVVALAAVVTRFYKLSWPDEVM